MLQVVKDKNISNGYWNMEVIDIYTNDPRLLALLHHRPFIHSLLTRLLTQWGQSVLRLVKHRSVWMERLGARWPEEASYCVALAPLNWQLFITNTQQIHRGLRYRGTCCLLPATRQATVWWKRPPPMLNTSWARVTNPEKEPRKPSIWCTDVVAILMTNTGYLTNFSFNFRITVYLFYDKNNNFFELEKNIVPTLKDYIFKKPT